MKFIYGVILNVILKTFFLIFRLQHNGMTFFSQYFFCNNTTENESF